MRNALATIVVFVASCASTEGVKELDASTPPDEAVAALQEDPAEEQEPETAKPDERKGVLIPADAAAISLWPEAYSGELLVLEVAPHGSPVAEGDVVAQLDTRAIEEQIADAQLDLESTRIQHAGLLGKNAIAAEAAAAQLARTEAALGRARRTLEGHETQEREFTRRIDEISRQREAAWESDQVDELDQLEAMYAADELVDATEEIVLKRSRRDLAQTRASNTLSEDRRGYRIALADAITLETKRENVEKMTMELQHLRRTQAIDALGRADAEKRSAAALAKKEKQLARLEGDFELLTVRAPRAGVLLHGALDAYRKGGAPNRLERGSQLAKRKDMFLVAEPGALAVALAVPETERGTWVEGATVLATPLGADTPITGTLTVASFPSGAQGEESTFEATAKLEGIVPELVPGVHVSLVLEGVTP